VELDVRPLVASDRAWLTGFMTKRWGVPVAAGGGRLHRLDALPGFAAVSADGTVVGVVTYLIEAGACEVISIDAVVHGEGVGTALLEAACEAAVAAGCRDVHLITTNDNVDALRFYQPRIRAVRAAAGSGRRVPPHEAGDPAGGRARHPHPRRAGAGAGATLRA
jgi:ribosomal protein S18 acetylase RimI-like enzyme